METYKNLSPSEEAMLNSFFAEHAESIADDGFTERVLQALPTENVRLRLWSRSLDLVTGAATVGLLLYLGVFSRLADVMQNALLRTIASIMAIDTDQLLVELMRLLHRLPHLLPSAPHLIGIAVAAIVLLLLAANDIAQRRTGPSPNVFY